MIDSVLVFVCEHHPVEESRENGPRGLKVTLLGPDWWTGVQGPIEFRVVSRERDRATALVPVYRAEVLLRCLLGASSVVDWVSTVMRCGQSDAVAAIAAVTAAVCGRWVVQEKEEIW